MHQSELVRLLLDHPASTATIVRLYLIALARAPDPSGLVAFHTQLVGGMPLAAIAEAVLQSEEHRARFGDRDMVSIAHRAALGRDAPTSGDDIAALVTELVRTAVPPAWNDDFRVPERAAAAVTQLYKTAFGRGPDTDGMAHFTGRLTDGEALNEITRIFVRSDEFASQGTGTALVARLYSNRFAGSGTRFSDLAEFVAALVALNTSGEAAGIVDLLCPAGLPLSEPLAYQLWIREIEERLPIPERPAGRHRDAIDVSWIVPIVDQETDALEHTINSVLEQHGACELVLAWYVEPDAALRALLERSVARSKRVVLTRGALLFPPGLRLRRTRLRGRFTVWLNPGDRLAAVASLTVASAATSFDILIADEDQQSVAGERHSPRFRGAWDPELAMATGDCGFVVIKSALLQRLAFTGRWKGKLDATEILRRLDPIVAEERIGSVPRVLCHRAERLQLPRAGEPSRTSVMPGNVTRATRLPVQKTGTVQIDHPLPRRRPLASIIIPTRDMADLLSVCVASILRCTLYARFEILIIDNGSTEASAVELLERLSSEHRIRIIRDDGPFNWSRLNNIAVLHMAGDLAVFLNNDTEVLKPEWLDELVSHAMRPDVGAVGALLLYPDQTIQHAGIVLGPDGMSTHVWRYAPASSAGYLDQIRCRRRVTAVTGACLATRRGVLAAARGFEEEKLRVTWSDVDYCLRVGALGLHVVWTPKAILLHHEKATRGSDSSPAEQQRVAAELHYMRCRWGGLLDADKYWSPNLVPSAGEPMLAFNAHARSGQIQSWCGLTRRMPRAA